MHSPAEHSAVALHAGTLLLPTPGSGTQLDGEVASTHDVPANPSTVAPRGKTASPVQQSSPEAQSAVSSQARLGAMQSAFGLH
jgi:hypothetical protein